MEQAEFTKFHAYYNFTPRFCNPAAAHEKGGIEGLVGYVRRNYFVPLPEADSFEALNQQLLAECLAYGEHRLQGRENWPPALERLLARFQEHQWAKGGLGCRW